MRNTRNNPPEDLGMHLLLICDRYEVRDDVFPGGGKFRGGADVVKSQRYLTPGFMTHESDRHLDAPWGVFGGKPGTGGKMKIYNIADADKIRQEYSKFSGMRTDAGDVVSYFSPSVGGDGDPIARDPLKVLDDVLDGFIAMDHAKDDYAVVMLAVDDGYGWQADEHATIAKRSAMQMT